MTPKMDIIVSEGRERKVYPGVSDVKVSGTLPEYRGGVTMTIRFAPPVEHVLFPARITVDPNIRGGVPCVGNGNWPIAYILEKLASGILPDRLAHENPNLTIADIQLALDVSSWVMRDPTIDWSALDLSNMVDFHHELKGWQSLSDEAFGHSEKLTGD